MLNLILVLGMLIPAGKHPARNIQQRIKNISSKIQEYRVKRQKDKLSRLFKQPKQIKNIPYYQIEGKVYDTDNNPVIAGCYVYVYDAYSGDAIKSIYPDINGEFVDTFPMGAYIIEVQGDMYPTYYYTAVGGTENIENAEIVWLTQNTDSINFHIPSGNVLIGTAYDDSTNSPITNMYGSVALIDTITRKSVWKPFSSDSNGTYVIEGINKGDFKIKFYVPNYENMFLGNTLNWFDAQVISFATWGDTITGADVNLVPTGQNPQSGNGVITGLLLSDTGDTVKDLWPYMQIFEANTNAYVYANFDYDSTTGIYIISDLPTGSYKVMIDPRDYLPQFYNDKDSIQDADPVSVTDGDTTYNIDFNFHKGGAISGTITDTNGYGYAGAYYFDVYDSNTGDYIYGMFGGTLADGKFTTGTDIPTGTYKAFMYPYDIEAGQWYKDAQSFETADTINVTAPDTTYGINFNFYGWTGIISGTVTDADGNNVKAYVDLYFGDTEEYISSAMTVNGRFTLRHLPEGSYVLYIYPEGLDTLYYLYMGQWYDGEESWDSATRITLNQGDSVDIHTTLAKGGRFVGSIIDSVTGNRIPSTAYQFYLLMIKSGNSIPYGGDVSKFGTYRSDVLFPGDYKLLLIPLSLYDTSLYAPENLNPYHFEFYDESTNFAGATQINLPVDSVITCDFTTVKVQGAVEGNVMNGTNPISGKDYMVIAVNTEGYPVAAFTSADTAGYHVGGLLPGDYYLYLWPYGLWYNQVYYPIDIDRVPYNIPSNAQPVTIGNSVITGINFDITGVSEHHKTVKILPKLNTIIKGNMLFLSGANNVKSLKVFDINGREVSSIYNRNGEKTLKVSLKNVRSGIYFLTMELKDGESVMKKVIRLK